MATTRFVSVNKFSSLKTKASLSKIFITQSSSYTLINLISTPKIQLLVAAVARGVNMGVFSSFSLANGVSGSALSPVGSLLVSVESLSMESDWGAFEVSLGGWSVLSDTWVSAVWSASESM